MKAWVAACCIALGASFPAAAQKAQQKKGMKPRVKVEKLACRLGTEDQHARIAVQLANGKVDRFAYYSKWKPRTCSMEVQRGDAYSRWEDTGNVTVVTLFEDNGAFLIDHGPGRYHFIFRNIDRMRYCGMEGKVSGSLTVFKGKPRCELEGVMDEDGNEIATPQPESQKVEARPGSGESAVKAPDTPHSGSQAPGAKEPEAGQPASEAEMRVPGSTPPDGDVPQE
jgi:hypothetical protein